MKKNSDKISSVTLTGMSLTALFFIFSFVPILGPSILAYTLGIRKNNYENNGFSKIYLFLAMFVGILIAVSVIAFVLFYGFHFCYLNWTIGSALIINYLFSIVFYFLGVREANIKCHKF